MQTTNRLMIGATLVALALAGTALAHGDGGRAGMQQRDGTRVEQSGQGQRTVARRESAEQREQTHADRTGGHRHLAQRDPRHVRYHDRRSHVGRWVDARQHRQHHRIRAGRRAGEITRGEARQLYRQQARIARMERRITADGHVTGRERRHLDRALDRASRQIRQARPNDIYRGHDHYVDSWWHGRG